MHEALYTMYMSNNFRTTNNAPQNVQLVGPVKIGCPFYSCHLKRVQQSYFGGFAYYATALDLGVKCLLLCEHMRIVLNIRKFLTYEKKFQTMVYGTNFISTSPLHKINRIQMVTPACWKLNQRFIEVEFAKFCTTVVQTEKSEALTSYLKEVKFLKSQTSLLKEIAMTMEC